MGNNFPNIEQYSNDQLDALIALAEEILNAHEQSKPNILKNHGWTAQIAA